MLQIFLYIHCMQSKKQYMPGTFLSLFAVCKYSFSYEVDYTLKHGGSLSCNMLISLLNKSYRAHAPWHVHALLGSELQQLWYFNARIQIHKALEDKHSIFDLIWWLQQEKSGWLIDKISEWERERINHSFSMCFSYVHAGNTYLKLHFSKAFTAKQIAFSQQSDTVFYKVFVNLPLQQTDSLNCRTAPDLLIIYNCLRERHTARQRHISPRG